MKGSQGQDLKVRQLIMAPLLTRLTVDTSFRNRIISIIPVAIDKTIRSKPETSLDKLIRDLFPMEVKMLRLNHDETLMLCLAARVLNVPHQNSDQVAVHPIELLPSPDQPVHWVEKGKIICGLGFYWNGIRCFEMAIKMDSKCAEAYCEKGDCLFHLGRITTVIDQLDVTRSASPIWNQLEHLKGVLEESIHCFDQAIRINPRYIDPIYLKGACFIELGRPANDITKIHQAVACFRQVLSIDPKHENARLALQICEASI